MTYSYFVYNNAASSGSAMALDKIVTAKRAPVLLCIGSDVAVGDSLAPLIGTLVKKRLNELGVFVYGTLDKPVTAKECTHVKSYIKKLHPDRKIIAVDAAFGEEGDIGLIKISKKPLSPGKAVGKTFDAVGDVRVLGVVAENSSFNFSLLTLTRLNLVYSLAQKITEGLIAFYECRFKNARSYNN